VSAIDTKYLRQVDEMAEKMYTKYCEAVGGKAFNGDPLPAWKDFVSDEKKLKQVVAWREVAKLFATDYEHVTREEDPDLTVAYLCGFHKRDDLIRQLEEKSARWEETAQQYGRNSDYYFGLLKRIAYPFGDEACTADDGSLMDSPIMLKVPELVNRMRAENTALYEFINREMGMTATDPRLDTLKKRIVQLSSEAN
jgi:hypothetical protein